MRSKARCHSRPPHNARATTALFTWPRGNQKDSVVVKRPLVRRRLIETRWSSAGGPSSPTCSIPVEILLDHFFTKSSTLIVGSAGLLSLFPEPLETHESNDDQPSWPGFSMEFNSDLKSSVGSESLAGAVAGAVTGAGWAAGASG